MAPDREFIVLVGDDDVAVRGAVVDVVAARGLRVHSAGCGADALRILLSHQVDLTILDVEMPDMTGVEVVRRYRSGAFVARGSGPPVRRPNRALPTILMSGNPAAEIRSACGRPATFPHKPIRPDRLSPAPPLAPRSRFSAAPSSSPSSSVGALPPYQPGSHHAPGGCSSAG